MNRHIQTLDGIRGLAAISVLLFHLGHWLNAPWLATNSNLSVDLFFCLSGYVLPLAYWSRRGTISNTKFFILRAIRLMPLVILSALISLAYVLLKVKTAHLPVSSGTIAVAAASSFLDIPIFGAPHEIDGPMVFPLNGPQFTLFLEFVANIIWWALRKNTHRYLLVGAIVASAGLVYAFGLGGDTDQTFLLGFPRVALSFTLGLTIYHLRLLYNPSSMLNLMLFMVAGSSTIILFYYPLIPPRWLELFWIIAIAPTLVLSATLLTPPRTITHVANLLGGLSYPVYALHYPIFCWVNGIYRSRFGVRNFSLEAPLACAIVIGGAYVALLVYDQPVRSWLTAASKRLAGRPTPPEPPYAAIGS